MEPEKDTRTTKELLKALLKYRAEDQAFSDMIDRVLVARPLCFCSNCRN